MPIRARVSDNLNRMTATPRTFRKITVAVTLFLVRKPGIFFFDIWDQAFHSAALEPCNSSSKFGEEE